MDKVLEDYVSFETAKLLKEKGFQEDTRFVWYLKEKDFQEDTRFVRYEKPPYDFAMILK